MRKSRGEQRPQTVSTVSDLPPLTEVEALRMGCLDFALRTVRARLSGALEQAPHPDMARVTRIASIAACALDPLEEAIREIERERQGQNG